MAFIAAAACRQYIRAGNATVTVISHRTGNHFTYNVKSSVHGGHYVKRVGKNQHHFYLGMIKESGQFVTTKNSAFSDKGMVPFRWVWEHLAQDRMPPECTVQHEGKCGVCNRPLTDPESVELGVGPVCRSKFIASAC